MLHALLLLGSQLLTADGLRSSAPTRAHESWQESDEERARVVLEGSVLDPHGAPAQGALVVSGAGGRAVVDASGRYRLELSVPRAAREVQVTAVGASGTNVLASTRVELRAPFEVVSVRPLLLAQGTGCAPGWLPTFGEAPGVFGTVYALAAFDDGTGTALYAGGTITGAGAVVAGRVVKWDGERWAPVGTGPVTSPSVAETVYCLAVFDDGGGPALYAGGQFSTMGAATAHRIAKWDGVVWSPVGSATGTDFSVLALAVFDDGSGPALYAGGEFHHAGGVPASYVARWDGASWAPLGSGVNGPVIGLQVHDDGSGAALYAAGDFTQADGLPANFVARWDGASWSAVHSGMDGSVRTLTVHDDGNGPALYAGGEFQHAGGVSASNIARWDGSSWSPLGSGVDAVVNALAVFDDGAGAALHAAGAFTSADGSPARGLARWDGTSWSAIDSGMDTPLHTLAVVDLGTGPLLYAGGDARDAGGVPVRNVASWNGSSWQALGNGPDDAVSSLLVHDDGGGAVLYAGGLFTSIDGVAASHVARWDGTTWSPLGSGTEHPDSATRGVRALALFDDGSGPALYAGGEFTSAGGVPANRIARWDGASWSALGTGMNASVEALAVFDDGTGPALYAGGEFSSAGGVAQTSRIARWDGASWSAVGGGASTAGGAGVRSLLVFDDGSGEALYVGGNFSTAGGVTVHGIAKWSGTSWSSLGGGITSGSGAVRALAVWDDGGGPALYAAGNFFRLGNVVDTRNIAKWNGTSWSPLGIGVFTFVYALAEFDDGTGPALFAGGGLTTAGGLPVQGIAKWDGTTWSSVGSGVNGALGGGVLSLAVFEDGRGPALYAGGNFSSAPDSGDSYLSRWGCPDTTAPSIDCPTSLVVLDRIELPRGGGSAPGEIVNFAIAATDDQDPAPLVACEPPSGSFFPRGTTLVTCTATDATGNESICVFPLIVQEHVPVPPVEPLPSGM